MEPDPTNKDPQFFRRSDAATHAYLGFVQGVIGRMAASSTTIKALSAAMVPVVLAVEGENQHLPAIFFAAAITVVLAFMDAYYLSLERDYRQVYSDLLSKLNAQGIPANQMFLMKLSPTHERSNRIKVVWDALFSKSVGLFYAALFLGIVVFAWFSLGGSHAGNP